ncbi:MAG: hypothetical protein ACM31C_09810 [Acidobacteriota bacterium]
MSSRRILSSLAAASLGLAYSAATALAQTPDQPPPAQPPEQPAPPTPPEQPQPPPPPPDHHEPVVAPAPTPPAVTPAPADTTAPLSFKIGDAYFTPIGFMDFTGVWRSKTNGGGIGTNFGNIPYGVVYGNHLGESRFSMQNSRIGLRIDAPVHGSHVIGYLEADFLGAAPGNVTVSSNSNTLRSRVYWVDIRKGALELLAGQSWSLITAGRKGISPLPGDVFYTQNVDVNYQAGMVWGRYPELRLTLHPAKEVAFALALDSPEQYVGGSAGGGLITLPSGLTTLAGTQLDNGTTGVGTPEFLPDVIAKLAIDPVKQVHVEAGGVERQFKIWNPANENNYSATGVGGFLNLNLEPTKGLHLISNNFYGAGVGRYIFGQAPDVIVEADGTLDTVKAGSTLDGVELKLASTLLFGYFSYLYIDKATAPAAAGMTCMDAMSCVGYGYPGAPVSQNKDEIEETVGFNQTFWKDPKYGALNLMGQYSHLTREPWAVPMGGASNAHINMVFLNLRYTLPGEAPKLPD